MKANRQWLQDTRSCSLVGEVCSWAAQSGNAGSGALRLCWALPSLDYCRLTQDARWSSLHHTSASAPFSRKKERQVASSLYGHFLGVTDNTYTYM